MAASVPDQEDNGFEAQIRSVVRARGGEVSARNRAARLAETYLNLNEADRLELLRTLATFDSDPETVARAYQSVQDAADPAARAVAQANLRRALEPPRLKVLTQFTTIPDGRKFLVDLRAFLLDHRRQDPLLDALESDLRGLLSAWFDIGFLELQRIGWSSPASLLEKLVGYEAVHLIRSWRDLKNRLDSDRRCYAFFHPRMPAEPLIFVEIALTKGLAGSVQKLLDEKAPVLDPREADTAIFYSISNCQRGLSGISLGNFLIKRVVEELSAEFRNLHAYATLSPVTGFRRWLDPLLDDATLLTEDERTALQAVMPEHENPLAALLARPRWFRDPALVRAAEPALTRLCARYLLNESNGRRARRPGGAFSSVEWRAAGAHPHVRRHLRERRQGSATLMVNYLYDLEKIEDYHEDYVGPRTAQRVSAGAPLARASVVGRERRG